MIDRGSNGVFDVPPVTCDDGINDEAVFSGDDVWAEGHVSEDRVVITQHRGEVRQPRHVWNGPANREATYRLGWAWPGFQGDGISRDRLREDLREEAVEFVALQLHAFHRDRMARGILFKGGENITLESEGLKTLLNPVRIKAQGSV